MSIWNYQHFAEPKLEGFTPAIMERRTCLYCRCLMSNSMRARDRIQDGSGAFVRLCSNCGWWHVTEGDGDPEHDTEYGGFACLRSLDLLDLSTPISEVKQFLLACYEHRPNVHPRLFEETVAAVLSDLGFSARVTNYGRDNGIDIYLDGPENTLIGVQVKRWRNKIKIDQIHSLAGALIVNHCTKGVFVTTSYFQPGAIRNARSLYALTGIPIELVDADSFYAALQLTRQSIAWKPNSPEAPWNANERPYLWHNN